MNGLEKAMLLTALLAVASIEATAASFVWRGDGWYVLDKGFADYVGPGPFASEKGCLGQVDEIRLAHPATSSYCTYHREMPLPRWLSKLIAERKVPPKILAIFEASYGDERVFVFATGVEESELFDEAGKSICEYGGFTSQVQSGSCDPNKIVEGRTVYPPGRSSYVERGSTREP